MIQLPKSLCTYGGIRTKGNGFCFDSEKTAGIGKVTGTYVTMRLPCNTCVPGCLKLLEMLFGENKKEKKLIHFVRALTVQLEKSRG